jgi:uncharacterized membrane protein
MIKNKKILLIFVISLILIISTSIENAYADRSMDIERVIIDAEILNDGTLVIKERRTIYFEGQYNGYYQNLVMEPGVGISDIKVSENGTPYEYNPGDDYGPPGTYLTKNEGSSILVDWSIDAFNETRTFLLEYKVHNQVKIHDDIGELYYKFIGDETDMPQENVTVNLILPEGSQEEDLRAWGHGPLSGNVELVSSNEVSWYIDTLPPRTFLEGRVTFTPSIVNNSNLKTNETALPDILEEEQELANAANRKRALAKFDWGFGGISLIGSAVFGIFMRRKYAKPYETEFKGDYYRDLPADYSPGELGYLIRKGRPNSTDFTATIIDLAQRGFIKLEEVEEESRFALFSVFKKDETTFAATKTNKEGDLKPHEKEVMDLLFYEISDDGESVVFTEIERYAKKHPKTFRIYWQDFLTDLKNTSENHNFFDESNKKTTIIGILSFIGFGFLGFITFFFTGMYALGFGLVGAGFISMLLIATINRRSKKGEEDYVRWMAFKKFLLHFSEMKRHELPSLVIWEHYMVYAVTLGVAKEVMKELQIVYPDLKDGDYRFGYGWYYYSAATGSSIDNLTNSFDNLTTSINNSLNTALSNTSSGSGGGGGFSGGGGGGGGGGGIGGR